MSLEERIREECWAILDRKGWQSFKDIEVKVQAQPAPFMAFINLQDRSIHYFIGEEVEAGLIERLAKGDEWNEGVLKLITYAIVVHEYGHHRICPRTQENFENIVRGAYDALEGREYREETIKALCLQMHNLFSDTVLNTVNSHTDSEKEQYREGLARFYHISAKYNEQLQRMMRKAVSRFVRFPRPKDMFLFERSNHILCQTPEAIQQKILRHRPRFFFKYNHVIHKLLDIFTGDEKTTETMLRGNPDPEHIAAVLERIQDHSQWYRMAYDYTTIMYEFYRKPHEQYQNSFSNPQRTQGNQQPQKKNGQQQGQQGGQQPKQQQNPQGEPQQQQPQGGGNNEEKKGGGQGDQDDKKDGSGGGGKEEDKGAGDKEDTNGGNGSFVNKFRREQEETPGSVPPGGFFKWLFRDVIFSHTPYSSPYLFQYHRLDQLYRERAGHVRLIAESPDRELPKMELLIGSEEMPLSDFNPRTVDWSSTRIGPRGVQLYRKVPGFTLPIKDEDTPGGIPDLSFIVDSSSSMNFDPWEGTGEYHIAALTFYSLMRYLEEEALAPLLNFNMINFAGATVESGWQSYHDIERVKRTLFDYQCLGTYLDPNALRNLRLNRRDEFICFMLSDTGFNDPANTQDLLRQVDAMIANRGIGFYLFQIGDHSEFSLGVEERGLPVQCIKDVQEFQDMTIAFTRELYGRVV